MNDDLRELYQEVIIEHSQNPRHFGSLDHPTQMAQGHNPLCGDALTLYVQCENNKIANIAFKGHGCAISVASASLLTDTVLGKTIEDALQLFKRFHDCITTDCTQPIDAESLDKLQVLMGVREFPMRVKCATLAWHTLEHALHQDKHVASTEGEDII